MNNIERRHLERRKRKQKKLVVALIAVIFAIAAIVLLCSFIPDTVTEKHYITYTVQSGDTLWSIARDIYGDSYDIRHKIDDIEHENGIMDARIYTGMRLRIEVDGRA